MLYWKIAGGMIAGALMLFAVGELQRLTHRSAAYADCQAQAQGKAAVTKGSRCAPLIVAQLDVSRSAQACDFNLGPTAKDPQHWAAPLSCSPKIQQLVISRNAGWDTVADRDLEIDRLNSGQAAAIARAQARGVSQAWSEANAKAAIAAAPRDPAGLIVCSDLCLRQLAGEGPARSVPADARGSH